MPLTPTAKALLYKDTGQGEAQTAHRVEVQFNPTTLSYSVQNTLEKKGKDAKAKQFVAQSTAKLEFDLVFDATHDGKDVRAETSRIKEFLNPGDKSTNKDQAPPVVGFRWGTFKFKGVMESFKETLDFFSVDGVPLRSTVKVSLAAQDPKDVFTDESFDTVAPGVLAAANTRIAPVPPGGATQMASQGGDPRAGRALAAQNGFESMRNPGAGFAAVAGGGVELKAAAAFSTGASTGAGFGIGGGVGIGIGAGPGAGGGLGVSVTAGAGAGLGTSASAASRGVAASQGAFAGLSTKAPAVPRTAALDVSAFDAKVETPPVASEFALGGKAVTPSSGGLRADVGPAVRIKFD
jgi:hypothetical protein